MNKIRLDQLANSINKELLNYSKVTNEEIQEIIEDVTQSTKEEIISTSPEDRGKYAKSWSVKEIKSTSTGKTLVIHNKKHYQLTHLLEFGHATRDGGRTEAFPHISPAEEKAIKEIDKKLKERFNG